MTWNHRVFRKHTGRPEEPYYYQIHEVYYNDGREIDSWTVDAVAPHGETLEELINDIEWFKKATEQPVLDEVELETMIAERKKTREEKFEDEYGGLTHPDLAVVIDEMIEDICPHADGDFHCTYVKGHKVAHYSILCKQLLQEYLWHDHYPNYPNDRSLLEE